MFNVRLDSDFTNWSQYFRFGYELVDQRPSGTDWHDVWCQLESGGEKLIVVSTPNKREAEDVLNTITESLRDGVVECDLRAKQNQWRDKSMWKKESGVTKEQAAEMGAVPIQQVVETLRVKPTEEDFSHQEGATTARKVKPTKRRIK